MKLMLLPICCLALAAMPAMKKIGIFSSHSDIGNPAIHGDARFDKKTGEYFLSGGGYNIWFKRDEFHFLYNALEGDFVLNARMQMLGEGKEPHRKIGWMIRESLDEDAGHICAALHGDGSSVLQWRGEKGASMRDPEDEIFSKNKHMELVQLERKGPVIIMRAAGKDGTLEEVGRHEMTNLPKRVYAGLFLCSHNAAIKEEGKAWEVSISKIK